MLRQLRRRMTLLCAGITGIILLVMSLVSLAVSETQLEQRGQAMFQSLVNDLAFRLTTERILDWSWLSQMETENKMVIHVESNGSPILFPGSWQAGADRDLLVTMAKATAQGQYGVDANRRPRSFLNSPQAFFSLTGADGVSYRAAVVVIRTQSGYISLTVLQDSTEPGISRQRMAFACISFGALGLLLGFSWWFAGRVIRPVSLSRQRQAEFIAAASHELRTPLAVIRTSAAALELEKDSQNSRFAQTIDRECVRTSKLVDELLTLANADAKNMQVDLGPVELEEVLQSSAQSFEALARQKGQTLYVEPPASPLPVIAGDESRLVQLVGILLDNACRHTPEGGYILLYAHRQGRFLRMCVQDNGPGIPREHHDKVFERFYRADSSRTDREHYGLGLSIAWEIVQLHRGKIHLSETPGGGLTAAVDLPAVLR